MPLLAESAVEKLRTLGPDVWLKIIAAFAVVVIGFFVIRQVLKMNKIIAGVVTFVVVSVVFFSWVYNRNEPKFLTPFVDRIAPFFPTAGAYNAKQQGAPGTPAPKKP
jgi:glucan phosphoethanolaminetransferase (alkaline phosphatase superfamily)